MVGNRREGFVMGASESERVHNIARKCTERGPKTFSMYFRSDADHQMRATYNIDIVRWEIVSNPDNIFLKSILVFLHV